MYLQNVISKTNKKKSIFFAVILEVTDGKRRIHIRIRKSSARIQGSGSVPKCHGSGTLQATYFVAMLYSIVIPKEEDYVKMYGILTKSVFPGLPWALVSDNVKIILSFLSCLADFENRYR
jgi:hypothetical protein